MVGTELPVPFQLGDGSGRAGLRKLLVLCTELVLGGTWVSDQNPETLVMTWNLCNALVQLLLQMNPYHVDSLLQLSDVCRMQEDQEMARDLIGKSEVRSRCVGVKSFPGRAWGGPGTGWWRAGAWLSRVNRVVAEAAGPASIPERFLFPPRMRSNVEVLTALVPAVTTLCEVTLCLAGLGMS